MANPPTHRQFHSKHPRADIFCSAFVAADSPPAPSGGVELALDAAVQRAQDTWPELQIDAEAFVRHIAFALRKATHDFERLIGELHPDLLLAWCAGHGDRAAMTLLHDKYLAHLEPELRQHLSERLFASIDGSSPKILQYAGRTPLERWFSVVARNTRVSLRATETKRVTLEESAVEQLLATSPTPELDVLRSKYRLLIQEGLRDALTRLRPRDRLVLRLTLVERRSLAKVGAFYNVDPSTVWHWLVKVRTQLREDIEHHLQGAGIPASDLPSVLRSLASQIDLSSSAWGRSG